MKIRSLHVASSQIHAGGSYEDILKRLKRQADCAAISGAEIILFPEGVLTGYSYDMTPDWIQQVAVHPDGAQCSDVRRIAEDLNISIIAGFIEAEQEKYFNSALVAFHDGSYLVQRKAELNHIENAAYLTPGSAERKVFTVNDVRCAVLICADGGIKDLDDMLRDQNVDYLFQPTGGGGKIDDMLDETDLQTESGRERYEENRERVCLKDAILSEKLSSGKATANALGPAGERTCHQGHCIITDKNYVLRAQIPGTNVLEHQQDQMIHVKLNF